MAPCRACGTHAVSLEPAQKVEAVTFILIEASHLWSLFPWGCGFRKQLRNVPIAENTCNHLLPSILTAPVCPQQRPDYCATVIRF